MLLKSLHLKNIRSYADERIAFPEGVVLLAGDIGAGKSTVLLAIEFALFGLLRGDLSGGALLRNGSREGTVELAFELDNRAYTIGRTLKRTKTSVEQDAGYCIEDGLRQELTATELKSKVLNLLGYPEDLITKSKSLIYRYTVYTPQEEMKRIILEAKESRLMILRKVFDIDKYKRIADNAATYAKLLRERKRAYEGQLVDEPLKRQQSQERQQQALTVQQKLLDIQPRLNEAKQAVTRQAAALETLEQQRAAVMQHRAMHQATEAELQTLAKNRQLITSELSQLQPLLAAQPQPPSATPQELALAIKQKQDEAQQAELELRKHAAARAELMTTRRMSEETARTILTLDQCPTCQQSVPQTHKHQIVQREEQAANTLLDHLGRCEESIRRHERIKQRINEDMAALQQQHDAAREAQFAFQRHQLHTQRKQQLETRLGEVAAAMAAAEQRKQQALAAVQSSSALETRFLAEKGRLDLLRQQEQHVIVEHATLLEQAKHLRETIALLEHDLAAKRHARAQLETLSTLHQWMGDFFTGLMAVMEKHVMAKVYHDFNTLFQDWFKLLIGDEVLLARLDEEFSPVVQQNGYDIEVSNLSGGEKTACALAYRLALNKVITALRSTVHTKDVIILDEPTDGFSADQLSRMREVLEQLRARQVILVSHEAAIESLADHVLRVVKEEHTSKIIV